MKKIDLNSIKALNVQGFFLFSEEIIRTMRNVFVFLVVSLSTVGLTVNGQNAIVGKWKTVDDKSGETKSIIELYEQDGMIFGRIVKLFPKPGDDPDPICDKCSSDDDRYNKKIIGMVILKEMKKDGEEYSNGNILNPEVGKIYRCKIWRESRDLKVRGYWGPLWRTQTWKWVS